MNLNIDNELNKVFNENYVEKQIIDLIMETDFSNPANWSIPKLKESLRVILMQDPSIEISYEKDAILSESGQESVEVILPKVITIYYVQRHDDGNQIKSKSYFINGDRM